MGDARPAAPGAGAVPRALGTLGALGALGVLAALGGCADQTKLRETELTQLLAWLPGSYESVPQPERDAPGARTQHERIALVVVRIHSPRLGHHALYAQEMAADDPRRVMSERILSFKVDEKRGIVETVYELVEPLRWRDGQLNKDLFSSMLTSDVQAEGCQLFWKKKDNGFVATHDPKACPDSGGGAAPQIEFNGGALTVGDYKFRKAH
jgi:CpeT/CpcT family (DUF1001)